MDASSFATFYNAFWAEHAPTSEHFVRRINLAHAERWSVPLPKPKRPIRAAVVAELAFTRWSAKIDKIDSSQIDLFAYEETVRRLRPLLENPATLKKPITLTEAKEVRLLEKELHSFFGSRPGQTAARPVFFGCGYIDESEGDILSGSSLFEVKSVDRPFRSTDIRQLITYCALNHSSQQYHIDSIGVFNPRRGTYFDIPVDEVAQEISGRSSQELFDSIVYAVSSGDISR